MARKPEKTKVELIHVIWRDSHSHPGWMYDDELTSFVDEDCVIDSVGFIVSKNEKWLVLAATVSEQSACDCAKIPISAILKMKKIARIALHA